MAAKSNLSDIVKKFAGKRILLVGDLCLSRFESCRTVRFAHEAPTLILRSEGENAGASWAGHAAISVLTLGGEPILVGLVGDDPTGKELLETLSRQDVNVDNVMIAPGRMTTSMKNIYAGGHNTNRRQVLRIHYEDRQAASREEETMLVERIESLLPRVDAICLCNHAPGIAARKVWMTLLDGAHKHKIHSVVDSGRDPYAFVGPTVLIQSEYEMVEVLGEREVRTPNEAAVLARNIQRNARSQAAILTRGNQGMVVVDGRKKPVHLGIYGPEDITDPTGVGETVCAATTLSLAAGGTVVEAARLASYAAGLAVMKPWLATLTPDELATAACTKAL